MRVSTTAVVTVVLACAVVGTVAIKYKQEQLDRLHPSDPIKAPSDDECANQTWELDIPRERLAEMKVGMRARESVPQRFVASAIQERGYAFPYEAERILLAEPNSASGPCQADGSAPASAAETLFRRGYKFRGYRSATAEEAREASAESKFGRAEQ